MGNEHYASVPSFDFVIVEAGKFGGRSGSGHWKTDMMLPAVLNVVVRL